LKKFIEQPFKKWSTRRLFFAHVFLNYIPLPLFINIALAVGVGIFFMMIFNIVHPPAGANPIIVIIGGVSYEYLINPIIFGSLIVLFFGIVLNKFILKKNYPLK